jgi:predicted ATPase
MQYFHRLHVQGFRRLIDVDLELRPLNVLIGANGSGKTSVLDIFSLLASSASGGLDAKLSELGGITSILSLGRAGQISFQLSTMEPQHAPVTYEFQLELKGVSYEIRNEKLANDRFSYIESRDGNITYREKPGGSVIRPNWVYNARETALSQVPRTLLSLDKVRNSMASLFAYYHALDVGPRAQVRLPQLVRPSSSPGRDGEELVSCLYNLQQTEPDRFQAIEDALKSAFPGFVELRFPTVAAGMLAMTWKDSNFTHPFYMNQLSEGMLRFLWLATLFQSPGLTGVVLIDEPEVSLHPELLSLLAELMREASARAQLIVATHADRLVRFLEPKEVVTLDVDEDGSVHAQWADQLDIEEWLKEYTLDEVWGLGRIGGRA